MSDIFISYKREEQPVARKLADALESEGWTVWWDPKLRAGEHFDDVIEKALSEAKCVIVMWSNLSVNSEYVKAEATEALEQKKLVPLKIEDVNLPFRFKRVHTLNLLGWDGSKDSSEFRRLVDDISAIVGPSSTGPALVKKQRRLETEERLKTDEEHFREQERQRAKRKADEITEGSKNQSSAINKWETLSLVSLGTAFSVAVILAVSIGGAFFADWFLYWGASVFNIQLQAPTKAWLPLLLGGVAWSIAYVFTGVQDATKWTELLLAPLIGWVDLFEFFDLGYCLRGIFGALPLNILIAWGLAHGAALYGNLLLRANYDGVIYLVFGVMTLLEIGMCIADA
jgi:hypothetical protein